MPDYNQTPIDVWSNFAQGMEIGGALRRQRQQQQYGEAYQQGGWGAVADTAGGFGDLETAQGAQGVQSDQQEAAIERAQRNATVLSNAATSLMGVPYEQRGQRLQQMAPMLTQMGLDEQQIAQFDPTDEALASVRAIQGQFSQFTDIQEIDGALVGIMPDGRTQVLREATPTWGAPEQIEGRLAQRNQRTGQVQWAPAPAGAAAAPSGYRYTPDGQSLEPIQGGPAAQDVDNRERTRETSLRGQAIGNQNVLTSISAARQIAQGGPATGAWSITAAIPGTPAHNLDAQIDTIVANIGFDRLQQMRDSSPTGGALGQVTERELALLQSVVASLRQSQSREQFLANLSRVEAQYIQSMERIEEAYTAEMGEPPPTPPPGPGSTIGGSVQLPGSGGLESLSEEQLDQLERELTGQ